MLVKSRSVPNELKLFRSLNARMKLSKEEGHHLRSLEKGFEGEVLFDGVMETGLTVGHRLINDLMLKVNGNFVQMDSVLLLKMFYLFEVKNFEGEYYIEGNKWYTGSGVEINNPIAQLQRAQTIFARQLQSLGISLRVGGYVVFVNPQFTLYNTPRDLPIILPTQIPRLLNTLNNERVHFKDTHNQLMDKLAHLHCTDSPYSQKPEYEYSKLVKGIVCGKCGGFVRLADNNRFVKCGICDTGELVDDALLRSVKEYKFLFPEQEISTKVITDWCGEIISSKTVRRVLKKEFQMTKYGRATYYE